eukprot:PhF_6_TR21709/c0_g1_i2/m.31010
MKSNRRRQKQSNPHDVLWGACIVFLFCIIILGNTNTTTSNTIAQQIEALRSDMYRPEHCVPTSGFSDVQCRVLNMTLNITQMFFLPDAYLSKKHQLQDWQFYYENVVGNTTPTTDLLPCFVRSNTTSNENDETPIGFFVKMHFFRPYVPFLVVYTLETVILHVMLVEKKRFTFGDEGSTPPPPHPYTTRIGYWYDGWRHPMHRVFAIMNVILYGVFLCSLSYLWWNSTTTATSSSMIYRSQSGTEILLCCWLIVYPALIVRVGYRVFRKRDVASCFTYEIDANHNPNCDNITITITTTTHKPSHIRNFAFVVNAEVAVIQTETKMTWAINNYKAVVGKVHVKERQVRSVIGSTEILKSHHVPPAYMFRVRSIQIPWPSEELQQQKQQQQCTHELEISSFFFNDCYSKECCELRDYTLNKRATVFSWMSRLQKFVKVYSGWTVQNVDMTLALHAIAQNTKRKTNCKETNMSNTVGWNGHVEDRMTLALHALALNTKMKQQ